MIRETYYAMKRFIGGEKLSVRDKICNRYYPCPGNRSHSAIIGTQRGEILFKRYAGHYDGKCYRMYWNSHKEEYVAMVEHIRGMRTSKSN